jgi:predicted nuclease of predicted toxin-antitoxin system
MRLRFDHNPSHKLVRRLAETFAGSTQTRLIGMAEASDAAVWDHAQQNGLGIVTLDAPCASGIKSELNLTPRRK